MVRVISVISVVTVVRVIKSGKGDEPIRWEDIRTEDLMGILGFFIFILAGRMLAARDGVVWVYIVIGSAVPDDTFVHPVARSRERLHVHMPRGYMCFRHNPLAAAAVVVIVLVLVWFAALGGYGRE